MSTRYRRRRPSTRPWTSPASRRTLRCWLAAGWLNPVRWASSPTGSSRSSTNRSKARRLEWESASIAAQRLEAAGYQLGGAALKRPPAGFAADGPAGRFLLHKALFVHHDEPAHERVHDDAILAICMRHWSSLAPLHRWLTDNVQAA
jgi:hypothetical protein